MSALHSGQQSGQPSVWEYLDFLSTLRLVSSSYNLLRHIDQRLSNNINLTKNLSDRFFLPHRTPRSLKPITKSAAITSPPLPKYQKKKKHTHSSSPQPNPTYAPLQTKPPPPPQTFPNNIDKQPDKVSPPPTPHKRIPF